jgi:hypothetical protein
MSTHKAIYHRGLLNLRDLINAETEFRKRHGDQRCRELLRKLTGVEVVSRVPPELRTAAMEALK